MWFYVFSQIMYKCVIMHIMTCIKCSSVALNLFFVNKLYSMLLQNILEECILLTLMLAVCLSATKSYSDAKHVYKYLFIIVIIVIEFV